MASIGGLDEIIAAAFSGPFANMGLLASAGHISVGEGAGYNRVTGDYTPSEAEPVAFTPAVSSMTRELLAGVEVRAGDMRLTAPALQFAAAPKAGDIVTMNGERWTVLAVSESAGDVAFAYELHCRRR